MPTKKIKAKAEVHVPGDRDACAADIRLIGDLTREHTRIATAMNDEIAAATQRYQPQLDQLQAQIDLRFNGVKVWCEAHRVELTDGHRVKSANLVTGKVEWRAAPPSCSVRQAEAVIQTLKTLGLGAYVRTKEEVNKEAVLAVFAQAKTIAPSEAAADPAKATLVADLHKLQAVSGLTVQSGVEDFKVEPFEAEA